VLKLTYSNLEFQKFPGRTPEPPSSRGGKGRKGKEGGKDREGTETGEGRREGGEEWEWWGGEGRGGALDMGSAPLETSSGSAPLLGRPVCDIRWQ